MTNDYYNADSQVGRASKSRSAEENASRQAIAAGFDKLPSENAQKRNKVSYGVTNGSTNTYAVSPTYAWTAYEEGAKIRVKMHASNTGACTLNVSRLGARSIKLANNNDPVSGELTTGNMIDLTFDGTNFIIQSPSATHMTNAALLVDRVNTNNSISLITFGGVGDGTTDDTAAWIAANDYLEDLGGGIIQLECGKQYTLKATTIASKVIVRCHGMGNGGLKVHPDTVVSDFWMRNRTMATTATRDDKYIQFLDMDIDASSWPTIRWLTQADGTPITDPEADYVMGTGALASGISGTDLTAVLTSDEVTGVTINNGGAGWNGHGTFPYTPKTVPLRFTGGGGSGAKAYATISGGTLTSVTVLDGGSGYISAPTVTAQGGYADIALLADASVDRRNGDYSKVGSLLGFAKVENPVVNNVRFIGAKRRTLQDAGCLNARFTNCVFEDCGKKDGPFHCIWVQSHGNPSSPKTGYMDTENALVENIYVDGAERSAVMWAPTKGGVLRNLRATNCGESTIYCNPNLHYNGGRSIIENCHLSNNKVTDIVGQLIEGGRSSDLVVRNNLFEGSAEDAVHFIGGSNVLVEGNTFKNNVTISSLDTKRLPYGPYSERYDYNRGERPVAGDELRIESTPVTRIGTVGRRGSNGVVYRNNRFEEDRSTFPDYIFKLVRGDEKLSRDISIIENNLVNIPPGMSLIHTTIPNVMVPQMSLHIARNLGHASEVPVVLEHEITINETGTVTIAPGFRPSAVNVMATTNPTMEHFLSIGNFVWARDGSRTDYVLLAATDGANRNARFTAPEVVRIENAAGAVVDSVEFVAWKETGFSINVIIANRAARLRFVCFP